TNANAMGTHASTHQGRERDTFLGNIATNAARMAATATLLTYGIHNKAPGTTGSCRHTAAIRYGSTMQKTPTVASSHAPRRALGSNERLMPMTKARQSVTSCTARTASSIQPSCDCQ